MEKEVRASSEGQPPAPAAPGLAGQVPACPELPAQVVAVLTMRTLLRVKGRQTGNCRLPT